MIVENRGYESEKKTDDEKGSGVWAAIQADLLETDTARNGSQVVEQVRIAVQPNLS